MSVENLLEYELVGYHKTDATNTSAARTPLCHCLSQLIRPISASTKADNTITLVKVRDRLRGCILFLVVEGRSGMGVGRRRDRFRVLLTIRDGP